MYQGALADEKVQKAMANLLAKMDAALLPKEKTGPSVDEYMDEGFRALGKEFSLPPTITPAWRAKIQARLNVLGLNEITMRRLFENVKKRWKPPYSAESIVYRTDTLLSDYEPPKQSGGWTGKADFTGEE